MSEFETTTSANEEAASGRALIVLNEASRPAATPRRDAAFLAHLLATKAQAPQTRLRRRAKPAEALAAYRAAAGMLN